jgi:TRAP-type C4-dicarboxylate transport system substrate-binding protein
MVQIARIPPPAIDAARPLGRAVSRIAMAVALLLPVVAAAEPVTLKLSFYSSDRSPAYLSAVKPFVEAINSEGADLLKIDVYFSGALSPVQAQQPQLVLAGAADIAFIVPGQNPKLFSDNAAIELPGLFRDTREASLVHTRLVAAKALRGYEEFFVIAAVATQPETIHSRKPIASLAAIKGQKLRVNNATAAAAMAKLGALPVVLALNETSNAISDGSVDGAVIQSAQLFDVGIGRLVSNHYLLGTGSAPLALVMNRKVFDGLPEQAKNLIRDRSGEWFAARYIETSDAISGQVVAQIKADPRRKVIVPTPADQAAALRTFNTVADEWAALSPHNRELLSLVKAELVKLRSPN